VLDGIEFVEDGQVDAKQLNDLYRQIGWDKTGRRTDAETVEMLTRSFFTIAAWEGELLVGFARVCGDLYCVQVLDVITREGYRRRGIATRCMEHVVKHLKKSNYVSVTLTDGTGFDHFYEDFEFKEIDVPSRVWRPRF